MIEGVQKSFLTIKQQPHIVPLNDDFLNNQNPKINKWKIEKIPVRRYSLMGKRFFLFLQNLLQKSQKFLSHQGNPRREVQIYILRTVLLGFLCI